MQAEVATLSLKGGNSVTQTELNILNLYYCMKTSVARY